MLNYLFRIFLAFNSTSLLLVVYCIKSGTTLQILPPCFHVPNYVSYWIYILAVLFLTLLSLLCSNFLAKGDIVQGNIESIEYANDAFLPSYLGYFFVG